MVFNKKVKVKIWDCCLYLKPCNVHEMCWLPLASGWRQHIVRGLHEYCIAAEALKELSSYPGFRYIQQIMSFPSKCPEDDFDTAHLL